MNRKAKARLVILGYQDPELSNLERDSPTLSKLSRNLLLQLCVPNKWEIGSFDIKTAFLRGRADSRILGLEPPPELRAKLGLHPQEVCRLLKGAYGLVNAPLLWFRELTKALGELGFVAAPFDPCCYILPDEHGQARGFIGVHVDDGLFAGDEVFQINKLESQFPFGSRKKKDFVFTGLQTHQQEDFSITVDQTQYVKDTNPIAIDKERRKHPEEPINETERQAFRGLIGSLQYASVNTRPDLGSRLSLLQSRINNGQIQDLLEGNKLLHDAKSNVKCRYQRIPKEDVILRQAKLIKEHLSSSAQVADCLTKVVDISTLRELFCTGRYQLNDEKEILKNRSDKKTRLQWFKSHQGQPEVNCPG